MKELIIPKGYKPCLSLRETQQAIKLIKDTFQLRLSKMLNLERITAPIIVAGNSGINDDLSGVERKVSFTMKEIEGTAEVVQSLAKWKRMALYRYGYEQGCGIYTDMNAIRRDDEVDNIHSIFVDQWDWEMVINKEQRNLEFLKQIAQKIVSTFIYTHKKVKESYPQLKETYCEDMYFITARQLEDQYPHLSPKEREREITRQHKTVFIAQIGSKLKSGSRHDTRAPDYDDWALNGDILIWSNILNQEVEITSMGIRVDEKSLLEQLKVTGNMDRVKFDYHKGVLDGTLPLTIGGGIGQSRLCMLLLEKAHIGEVQVSVWPPDMIERCKKANIFLL